MRHLRPIRALAAVLLTAVTLSVAAPFVTSATAATNPPITVTATSPSTSSLKVSWSAAAGVGSAGWSIHLKDSAGRTWPGTSACVTCRTATIEGLPAGMRFDIQVVGYGTTPAGLGATVGTVQAGSCAGVTGSCVTVASTRGADVRHNAQGFLHGTTSATNMDKVDALDPQSWRIAAANFQRFARARQVGGAITVLMSDPWRGWADSHGMVGQNPWADWNKYREFITSTVQFHQSAGMVPEYWEVQNEPDYATQYTADQPATRALILEQYRVAHDAIRAVLPNARILGPSLSQYRFSEPVQPIDLRSFLDFAKANGLQFDIAWHEIGNSQPATLAGDPRSIVSHVDTVRAAIADRGLTDVRIHINEYGAAWNFDQPGVRVGYMAALETAGVDVAGVACWPIVSGATSFDTCFSEPGLLDGLLSPLGLETDTYAVHKAYAALSGRRVQTATTDTWTSAIAAADTQGTVRALVGRHQSCTLAVDQGCHAGIAPAPAGAPVTLALQMSCATRYTLTVQLVGNVHNALPGSPLTVLTSSGRRCNSSKVALPALTDGSAYLVTATPR